jgi:hypothetical protein
MANSGFSRAGHTLFNGLSAAGACILPGAQIGDTVAAVINITTRNSEASSFETTISKSGQIQQTSGSNLSANQYLAFTCG